MGQIRKNSFKMDQKIKATPIWWKLITITKQGQNHHCARPEFSNFWVSSPNFSRIPFWPLGPHFRGPKTPESGCFKPEARGLRKTWKFWFFWKMLPNNAIKTTIENLLVAQDVKTSTLKTDYCQRYWLEVGVSSSNLDGSIIWTSLIYQF